MVQQAQEQLAMLQHFQHFLKLLNPQVLPRLVEMFLLQIFLQQDK